jgi:membrane associated rhomboid family serine protease
MDGPDAGSRPFHRLLAALLTPPDGGPGPFVLTVFEPPLAILEIPEDRVALAILDRGGPPDWDLAASLSRLVAAPHPGALYVAVAGGGPEVKAALLAADRGAPDPNKLGMYHLDDAGALERVAGRRLGRLSAAAKALPRTRPLDPAEVPALMARFERERQEEARFAATLGKGRPLVTFAFGALCVALHLLSHVWDPGARNVVLLLMGALSAPLVDDGQIWRLLSYAFLHGSETHLIVNMLSLLSFGAFLEALVGRSRYVLLFGATALAGGAASAFVRGTDLSVGASGAIWGFLGAGLGLVLRPRGLLPATVAARMRRRLGSILIVNLLISFLPGIDLWAHLGGGLVGLLLALSGALGGAPPARCRWPRPRWPS